MRLLILLLAFSLLLAGCIKSVSDVPQSPVEKQSQPTPAVSEEQQMPSEAQEEVVENVSSEPIQEESTPSVEEVLATFAAGKMYYCKGTYSAQGNEATFESWFYYDADNNVKKVKYTGSSYGQDGSSSESEIISITEIDFQNKEVKTSVFSKGTGGALGASQDCDYIKLETTTPLEYESKAAYEESLRSEAQNGSFSVANVGETMSVDCKQVPYTPETFEPSGKVCALDFMAGNYG